MPNIFISHSNQDSAHTQLVVAGLRQAGHDIWVDLENIRGGADWLCEIEAGIQRCDALVTVLSPASAESVWVERECLYAFQLKKPVITALVADVLIPLHLINFQYCDLRTTPSAGLAKLVAALDGLSDSSAKAGGFDAGLVSRLPAEANFFPYLEQLPEGAAATLVARDLFHWARGIADEVAFGGRVKPVFHARLRLGGRLLTVFSVWAYRRTPSAQTPLNLLARHRPYKRKGARRQLLGKLNRLLPPEAQLSADQIDRRPGFPLRYLSSAERLEAFKDLVQGIIGELRAGAESG